jgi:hypothetical protein
MKKKRSKNIFDEYRSVRLETVLDGLQSAQQTAETVFRISTALSGGDGIEAGDRQIEDEPSTAAQNINQTFLDAFFAGHIRLSDTVLEAFRVEKNADNPNFALFRKYFRQGNLNLKQLLLHGLKKAPTDPSLLHDLAYFHEYRTMLGELIALYTRACELETDLSCFAELAQDFYFNTLSDGYDAYHALKEQFASGTRKGRIIEHLQSAVPAEPELADS